MQLTLATNWNNELLYNFDRINSKKCCIEEIYGSLRSSVVGTARASSTLPKVTIEEAKAHIELAHKLGIKFNYTFNTVCTRGLEYQDRFHHQLLEHLDEVVDLGIDSITVAIPYYLELIKNRYPELKTKVSVMSYVDSIQKLKIWESLGADAIVLCDSINRDFRLLKKLKEVATAELELLVSNACLHNCAYQYYHQSLVSHMSQSDNPTHSLYVEYPVMHCMVEKLSNVEQLIRSRWIRPEDLEEYEKLGFTKFKAGARQSSVAWNTRVATAYATRRYDGNLLDILQGFEPIADMDKKKIESADNEQWEMFKNGIRSFDGASDMVYIDNNKLNGFLEYYKKSDCMYNCSKCIYCRSISDKVIHIKDERNLNVLLETFRFVLGGLSISEILFEQK